MNIYQANISKKGNHVNITMVDGEGETRAFFHCAVKIGDGINKAKIVESENGAKYAYVKLLIKPTKAEKEAKPAEAPKPMNDLPPLPEDEDEEEQSSDFPFETF